MESPGIPHLTVELIPDSCCAVLRLDGEVDIATVEQVREATGQAVGLREIRHLVVDCRKLDFLDSSGLKIMLEAHRDFDGRIALAGATRAVTRILEVTGVGGIFSHAGTLEDARTLLHQADQFE